MRVRILAAAVILLAGGAFAASSAAAASSHHDTETASAIRAEVSDIREILNQLPKAALSIVSGESKATVTVPAAGRWSGSMWVPWVGNDGEMGKSIVVYQGKQVRYWIFQDYWNPTHLIRYSTTNSYQQSQPVPGANNGAGRKRLIIRADGTLFLEKAS